MWCEFSPAIFLICKVISAHLVSAIKNSSTNSVSKSPIFSVIFLKVLIKCEQSLNPHSYDASVTLLPSINSFFYTFFFLNGDGIWASITATNIITQPRTSLFDIISPKSAPPIAPKTDSKLMEIEAIVGFSHIF